MANVTIHESEMTFGPFPDQLIFHIENSSVYQKHLCPNGIKTCEFLLRRKQNILFVEAKKSCPNQIHADTPEEKKAKYYEYINDIVQKMRDSLNLYASMLLNCNENSELSQGIHSTNLKDISLVFVLVVKTAQPEWLEPFSNIMKAALDKEMRIWKIRHFLLLTEQQARARNLVE